MCNALSVRTRGKGRAACGRSRKPGLSHPHHHHTWPLPTGLSQPPHLPPHLSTPSHAYLHTYPTPTSTPHLHTSSAQVHSLEPRGNGNHARAAFDAGKKVS